jgi:hypothetical protein
MKKSVYQWQGEPVKVVFGYCEVFTNKEKLLYWYNYECDISKLFKGKALIPAIKIISNDNDYSFVIANHYGIGISKLKKGGWPNHTHFSLDNNLFVEDTHRAFNIRKFDFEQYSEYETNRENWQKENFPEEYNKIRSLRNMIVKK